MPRKKKPQFDEFGEEIVPEKQPSAAELMLLTIKPLGHEPSDDEEKRQVLTDLARLRMHRVTQAECAQRLGVSPKTIWNWLKSPLYEEVCADIERESKEGAILLVSDLAYRALSKLGEIMDSEEAAPFVQMESAKALLKYLGLEELRDPRKSSGQDDVTEFLRKAHEQRITIQVNMNGQYPAENHAHVVESDDDFSSSSTRSLIPALPPARLEPVLPGGQFPGAVESPLLQRFRARGAARKLPKEDKNQNTLEFDDLDDDEEQKA